jgi:uncharacterized protein (DUF2336 family)
VAVDSGIGMSHFAESKPAKPNRISADSFRRLTSLLKKDAVIPAISPVASVPMVPASTIPQNDIAPEIMALPEIAPVIFEEFITPHLTMAEQAFDIVPIEPIAPVQQPEIELEAAPVEIGLIEPIAPMPELAFELPSQAIELPIAETTAAEQSEIIELPSLPLDVAVVEPITPPPAPEPARKARPKLRDAFAQSPAALPPKAIVEIVAQTPEQEAANAELARSLLDMMAASNSTGLPQERALAADTLLRMLPKLPLKSLIMLSERICLMEAPPQLLVAKLIGDQRIEVSGPLLEDCSHISDEVLISVIQEGLPAKLRMMARRRKLSRAVSTALVQVADVSVLLTLVRNAGAEIAHESFVDLVQFASENTELLAPLCTRADLPVPFAFELFWHAPAQLRRFLLSRFLTDSETLTKILKITLDDKSQEPTFPSPERVKAAINLAAQGQMDDAAAELAVCANLNPATALRIISDEQGDPIAALLKAMGVPRAAAKDILDQAVITILDHSRDPEELQSMFDSLSFNKARILITYWDWATLQSGPYAPLN